MNQAIEQKGHPKGLYILFATEMWERFNYYGMRAILVLFMTQALMFDKVFASNLYGSYTGLVYLTPLLGGYIADKYWGNKRSIIAGGIVMAIGEFILFFCASLYKSNADISSILFFVGLGLMIAGNGFFKPNISSMVGQLYPKGDHRSDAAYTIFYMGINTGGAIGPFICGLVGNTGNPDDFKWAFLAGGIAMSLSVVVQKIFHDKYVLSPENKTLGLTPATSTKRAISPAVVIGSLLGLSFVTIGLLYIDAKVFSYLTYLLIAAVVFIAFFIFSDKSLSGIEKQRIAVIFIVSFFVVFFWSAFEQAGASLTFFADEQTNRIVGLNIPIWLIIASSAALLFYIYKLFVKTKKTLGSDNDKELRKTVHGLLLLFGLSILGGNIYLLSKGMMSIELNEIPASWFQSLNSIFVVSLAPLFAWLWLKLGKKEPSSPTKMALGLLLLAIGYLWIAFGVNNVAPGIKVSMIWLTGMYALHTCGELCLSPIGLSLVNKLAPFKFASLLMAVWFLANAAANKLAGVLSALYPDNKTTSFFGYQMSNLHEFFMLFVGMAGLASLILFLLTKRLQKMMHMNVQ
ncbi:peptide MFS transporter [Panacibacter ginsenosidivorans]|uniref:Peptide MFS transporter n=1 Tax=Panacibacter ginsenosidivorans TaxID=1813871 RepID=A0A5B8VBU5_9BACT|nr:peptide MFS transporter [Panacibacter ginsenosidivorans]QEC68156.1 peptide MFS transporter [Panacibacter ginsenosidivorans]